MVEASDAVYENMVGLHGCKDSGKNNNAWLLSISPVMAGSAILGVVDFVVSALILWDYMVILLVLALVTIFMVMSYCKIYIIYLI